MKRLVLFNGGLKDTFLAELAKREGGVVLCHLILYPPNATRLLKLEQLAHKLELPLVTYSLIQAPPLEETLLRMLFMVLHAIPIAKEKQCKCIYYGLSKDDDPRVVPILDAYVSQLNALTLLAQPLYDGKGIWLGQIETETPLRYLDRRRVIRLGNEWDIPWALTFSCERASRMHCGTCLSCLRRKEAFKLEGHIDSTAYRKEK